MAAHESPLHVQIARDVFGWQWREDWRAWCPPGWPARPGLGDGHGQRSHDQQRALQQHGGQPYGSLGALDDKGRPVIPAYESDPEATEILAQ